MKRIVVTGSPADGFTFIGPFDRVEDAIEWAEVFIHIDTWWVASLITSSEIVEEGRSELL